MNFYGLSIFGLIVEFRVSKNLLNTTFFLALNDTVYQELVKNPEKLFSMSCLSSLFYDFNVLDAITSTSFKKFQIKSGEADASISPQLR
jgi:hypothetical protein